MNSFLGLCEFIYVYEFYELVWYESWFNNWIHLVDYWLHLMNSYHDLLFWSIKFWYYMKSYNIWINILNKFIHRGFLQSFCFYLVTILHSIKLNPLTQPQTLKSRQIYIEVLMLLILIVVEVTNKHWMVIMDIMDLLNLVVLGMEKLEDDKKMNPHCFFVLLSTVAIHIILMWRNNTTISNLFNISNNWCPYSINFLTKPTNLIACFITKNFPGNISTLIHAKMNQFFFDFLETYHFLTCFQTWLLCLWIGTCLPGSRSAVCIMICICIKQQHHGQIIYHKLGKRNVHLGQKNEE